MLQTITRLQIILLYQRQPLKNNHVTEDRRATSHCKEHIQDDNRIHTWRLRVRVRSARSLQQPQSGQTSLPSMVQAHRALVSHAQSDTRCVRLVTEREMRQRQTCIRHAPAILVLEQRAHAGDEHESNVCTHTHTHAHSLTHSLTHRYAPIVSMRRLHL
jgi:hypothetical protein